MLTRRYVIPQYAAGSYYPAPYHVVFLADNYPAAGRTDMARPTPAPLNPAVTTAGGAGLRPYVGMDPSDPGTWSRPYNPQRGMFGRLHSDQQAAARAQKKHRARATK